MNWELFFSAMNDHPKNSPVGECDFECESPDFGLRDPDILLHRRGWDAFEIGYISYISCISHNLNFP